ncbi:hypothetical protein XENOCAPTIV_027639 [Xenoophorus captivus]|uniref:Uncharacterized protein n=1 Tax=Xenoophorus captivus TaxID=1517983 RepID=A0ABV0RT07_9TELE
MQPGSASVGEGVWVLLPHSAGSLPQYPPQHLHHHFHFALTHHLTQTHTLLSCSITDTTYCLPPTGVNLPTVGTLPKNKVYQVTAVSRSCPTVFVRKKNNFKLSRIAEAECSVCFHAYAVVVFFPPVRVSLCARLCAYG